MLPPEYHRQLMNGNNLELIKRAKRNRQLQEIEAERPTWKERIYLQIGNRLISMGENLKVLAQPRYNVPQGHS